MKKLACLTVTVLIIFAIMLVGCTDSSISQTYELVSIKPVDIQEKEYKVFTDFNFFYLTLEAKTLQVDYAYQSREMVDGELQKKRIEIEELSKCKLNKEKTIYTIKSGLFIGDITPNNGTIEAIIKLDDISYTVIFAIKDNDVNN